jgi:hypothetical protein
MRHFPIQQACRRSCRRRCTLEHLESRELPATFYVTNTLDSPTGQDAVENSLRWAIEGANANPGPDNVFFDIPAALDSALAIPVPGFDPASQLWTISLLRPLPAVSGTTTIDGYTQAHAPIPFRYPAQFSFVNESQAFILTGDPTGGSFQLRIRVPGQGLDITTGDIPFNASQGQVEQALALVLGFGNVLATGGPINESFVNLSFEGRFAGQDVLPVTVAANNLTGGSSPGVFIGQGFQGGVGELLDPVLITSAPNSVAALDGNDAHIRVVLDGSGINPDDDPNPVGIEILAPHTQIRGLAIGGFDVGIAIEGPDAVGARVQGDFLGVHVAYLVSPQSGEPLPGASSVTLGGSGNRTQGIRINSTNAAIGGTDPQENNVLCWNGQEGVWIEPGAVGNLILGNQIGVAGPTSAGRYFQLPNGASGVLIESSGNTVGGAVGGSGNIISANSRHGVWVRGPDASRNVISGNYLGAAPGGDFVFGAGDPGNLGDGVRIDYAPATRVGGSSTLERNVIVANEGVGVRIAGAAAVQTSVAGNFIGLLAGGTSVLGNSAEGVLVEQGASESTLGPTNVISGNLIGVRINGTTTRGHTILDNFIGTDAEGNADLGNAREGVRIEDAPDNRILGDGEVASDPGTQVISGNDLGIAILGPGARNNLVQGTFIGVNADATRDLGNSRQGILLANAPANQIGGSAIHQGNILSGNQFGLEIAGSSATGNIASGNWIGTDLTGLLRLRNDLDGILVRDSASGNLIGGSTPQSGNHIFYNLRDGIRLDPSTGTNTIRSNNIDQNQRLGIDVVAPGDPSSGLTPNDPLDADTGPNALQNAPTLLNVRSLRSATEVTGQLASKPNASFIIQFFATSALDPSGSGEGGRYLGDAIASTGADGLAGFTGTLPGLLDAGMNVTATAIDSVGNSSEFSSGIQEQIGQVRFRAATYSALESSNEQSTYEFEIELERMGGSGGYFTVDYAVRDGSASIIVDYGTNGSSSNPGATGTVIFGPGETVRRFPITIVDDQFEESDETVLLSLLHPAGPVTVGEPSAAVLTLVDDDQKGAARFGTPEVTAFESEGTVELRVVRDGNVGPVSVEYAVIGASASPGQDFILDLGLLVFAAGETEKRITVLLLGDESNEPNESLSVRLQNPSLGFSVVEPNVATVTILDDDQPGAVSFTAPEFRFDETAVAATLSLARSGPGGLVTVAYTLSGISATPGADFVGTGGTIVFLPGETHKSITIPLLADSLLELDESFLVTLANPTGGLALGSPSTTLVTVRNVVLPTPPVVVSLSAAPGPARSANRIVIEFNEPLDPARAVDLRNYGFSVRLAGRDRRLGTADDRLVGVSTATYDDATRRVTLRTSQPIPTGTSVLVTIHSAVSEPRAGVGVADRDGTALDGDRDGRAGGTFTGIVTVGRPAPRRPGAWTRLLRAGPR